MLLKAVRALRDDPVVWAIAALTVAVHMAVAGRYDFFRNELYYIVCGRHPDFGYADQPPLVPLIAAATQIVGLNVWLLRPPAALGGAALIPFAAQLALVAPFAIGRLRPARFLAVADLVAAAIDIAARGSSPSWTGKGLSPAGRMTPTEDKS